MQGARANTHFLKLPLQWPVAHNTVPLTPSTRSPEQWELVDRTTDSTATVGKSQVQILTLAAAPLASTHAI